MKYRSVAVILLFLTAATLPPPLIAAPPYETLTEYYNECGDLLGYKLVTCYNHVYYSGVQAGAYREVERLACEGSGTYIDWYEWNGTGWTYIGHTPPTWDPGPC